MTKPIHRGLIFVSLEEFVEIEILWRNLSENLIFRVWKHWSRDDFVRMQDDYVYEPGRDISFWDRIDGIYSF